MGFWAAIPAIAQVASSIFGKKKEGGETVSQESLIPSWQDELGKQLGEWAKQYGTQYEPGKEYTGKLTAPLSGAENVGLEQLNKILASPNTGELFGAAKGQLMDTLSGKFADPTQSTYIQSMQKLSQRALQDEIDRTRARRGGRGTYYHSKGIEEETDLSSRTLDYLNSIIGKFMETERGRQFDAVPRAAQLDQYETLEAPLAKVGASQTYGSLSRTVEQGDLERQYQDFLRKQGEEGGALETSSSLFKSQHQQGVKDWTMPERYEDNTIGQIANLAPSLIKIAQQIFSKGGTTQFT